MSSEKNNYEKLKIFYDINQCKIQNHLKISEKEIDSLILFIEKFHLDTSPLAQKIIEYNIIHNPSITNLQIDKYAHKVLLWNEKKGNIEGICLWLLNIGNNYFRMHFFDMAMKTLSQADSMIHKIKDDKNRKKYEIILYAYYATYYFEIKDYNKTIEYSKKQLELARSLKDTSNILNALNGLSVSYNETGKFKDALQINYEILNIGKSQNDNENIAIAFYNIANTFVKLKKTNMALYYIDSTMLYYHQLPQKNPEILLETRYLLMEIYLLKGDIEKVYEYRDRFFEIKDSINTINLEKEIAKQNSIYQLEKKEIEKQKLMAEKKQQQYIIAGAAVTIFLSLLLIFIVYRGYKQKQKANIELERKNQIIELQKKMVETHNKNITDSIHYASRIQRALLATDQYLSDHFKYHLKDYFILYIPKDIVSGDFYWSIQKENYFYFVVGDSTGHGVPGAFMSLLNINFLNESIMEKNITDTGKIFDYVKNQLTIHLHGEKDGMDATIIRFDLKNKNTIQYSAANHQPILITHDNEFIKCAYTKSPIGVNEYSTDNFTSYELTVHKGDKFYLFTDGYADQFGGEKDKKFQKSNFYRILQQYSSLPANEQKEFLKKIFIEWKGDREQTDDVCVAGLFF